MRGLGDCRFERANERWAFQGGNGGPPPSRRPGSTATRGPRSPSAPIDRGRQEFPWGSCTDNVLVRPARHRRRAALRAATAAAARLLRARHAVLRLEPQWPARAAHHQRPRKYYKGGQEQLWRIAADAEPRLYGPPTAGGRCGSGAWASPRRRWTTAPTRPTSLTSMADNKAAGAGRRCQTRLPDIAFARGVTARPTPAATCPSTAWHAQFADVNNDGLAGPLRRQGNISPDAGLPAMLDPGNLLLGTPRAASSRPGDAAGLRNYQRGRGGLLVDLNGDGLLDAIIVNRWDRAGCGATSAPARRRRLRPWAIGSRCSCARQAATAMRWAPGWRWKRRARSRSSRWSAAGMPAARLGTLHVGSATPPGTPARALAWQPLGQRRGCRPVVRGRCRSHGDRRPREGLAMAATLRASSSRCSWRQRPLAAGPEANCYSAAVATEWFRVVLPAIQQTPGQSPPVAARTLAYLRARPARGHRRGHPAGTQPSPGNWSSSNRCRPRSPTTRCTG